MPRAMGTSVDDAQTMFGVRYKVWVRDTLTVKERFFKTDKARQKFADKIQAADNFNSFVAWSEPQREEVKNA